MSINTVYIEQSIQEHPRVRKILSRLCHRHSRQPPTIVICQHYKEVFNPKAQNFRLQKQNPALILAEKTHRLVLPTPEGYGIGGEKNFYFSHMLNCLYDCRYCFLQGMYPSAHYVVFINYEDFQQAILQTLGQSPDQPFYFFSGYDGDSLAFEPITGFLEEFLKFFSQYPQGILELRTKSTNIRTLLRHSPLQNVVVAYSFTPDLISRQVENKVPSLRKRLAALQQLADAGWKIGLRLDPLIYADNFAELYQRLIEQIFVVVPADCVHSVSLGPLRFPEKMYQKIVKLYPRDKLLAHPLVSRNHCYSYAHGIEQAMKQTVLRLCQPYLDKSLLFECNPL